MTEFLREAGSSYWWISVVIVGLLINLASNLIQRTFEKQLSKISSTWKRRAEANKAEYTATVEQLANDPATRYQHFYMTIFLCFMSVFTSVLSLMFLSLLTNMLILGTGIDRIMTITILSLVVFLLLTFLSAFMQARKFGHQLVDAYTLIAEIENENQEEQ